MIYGYNAINIILNYLFTMVIGQNSIDTMLQIGIMLIVTLWMFKYGVNKVDFFKVAKFSGFILLSFLLSAQMFPRTAMYVYDNIKTIAFYLLMCAPIIFIHELSWIVDGFKIVGWLELVMSVLLGFVANGMLSIENAEVGYMVYGYKALPAAIILSYFYFKEGKKAYGIGAIFAALLILMFGSRGAILGVFISAIVFMFFVDSRKSKKKWILLVIGCCTVLLIKNTSFLAWLFHTLENILHFESRTLLKILEGTADSDSGRSLLIGMAKELLKGRWLYGYGLFGDRANLYLTSYKAIYANWFGEGFYVHNNLYEILLDFGIIPGILLIIILFNQIIRAIRKNDEDTKGIILICSCIAICSTIFSGSYLLNSYTYAMITTLVVYRRRMINEKIID